MSHNDKNTVPPVPVGLEDLVGMAAASPEFAEALATRRDEAVEASGVALAATERAVLAAVDEAALRQMVARCRERLADRERRAFLGQASAALLLLVGAGAAGCEKKSKPDAVRAPGQAPVPAMPAEPPPRRRTSPDAGAPPAPPMVSAGARAPRPRPRRPAGVKTGISPEHRRREKLPLETGSRPD